jgi:hypothetical protein
MPAEAPLPFANPQGEVGTIGNSYLAGRYQCNKNECDNNYGSLKRALSIEADSFSGGCCLHTDNLGLSRLMGGQGQADGYLKIFHGSMVV